MVSERFRSLAKPILSVELRDRFIQKGCHLQTCIVFIDAPGQSNHITNLLLSNPRNSFARMLAVHHVMVVFESQEHTIRASTASAGPQPPPEKIWSPGGTMRSWTSANSIRKAMSPQAPTGGLKGTTLEVISSENMYLVAVGLAYQLCVR